MIVPDTELGDVVRVEIEQVTPTGAFARVLELRDTETDRAPAELDGNILPDDS